MRGAGGKLVLGCMLEGRESLGSWGSRLRAGV